MDWAFCCDQDLWPRSNGDSKWIKGQIFKVNGHRWCHSMKVSMKMIQASSIWISRGVKENLGGRLAKDVKEGNFLKALAFHFLIRIKKFWRCIWDSKEFLLKKSIFQCAKTFKCKPKVWKLEAKGVGYYSLHATHVSLHVVLTRPAYVCTAMLHGWDMIENFAWKSNGSHGGIDTRPTDGLTRPMYTAMNNLLFVDQTSDQP